MAGRDLAPCRGRFMSHPSCPRRSLVLAFVMVLAAGPAAIAQDEHAHMASPPDSRAWQFSWDANVFLDWNYQLRKFTDFQRVESQNWLMLGTERRVSDGRLRLHTMLSF